MVIFLLAFLVCSAQGYDRLWPIRGNQTVEASAPYVVSVVLTAVAGVGLAIVLAIVSCTYCSHLCCVSARCCHCCRDCCTRCQLRKHPPKATQRQRQVFLAVSTVLALAVIAGTLTSTVGLMRLSNDVGPIFERLSLMWLNIVRFYTSFEQAINDVKAKVPLDRQQIQDIIQGTVSYFTDYNITFRNGNLTVLFEHLNSTRDSLCTLSVSILNPIQFILMFIIVVGQCLNVAGALVVITGLFRFRRQILLAGGWIFFVGIVVSAICFGLSVPLSVFTDDACFAFHEFESSFNFTIASLFPPAFQQCIDSSTLTPIVQSMLRFTDNMTNIGLNDAMQAVNNVSNTTYFAPLPQLSAFYYNLPTNTELCAVASNTSIPPPLNFTRSRQLSIYTDSSVNASLFSTRSWIGLTIATVEVQLMQLVFSLFAIVGDCTTGFFEQILAYAARFCGNILYDFGLIVWGLVASFLAFIIFMVLLIICFYLIGKRMFPSILTTILSFLSMCCTFSMVAVIVSLFQDATFLRTPFYQIASVLDMSLYLALFVFVSLTPRFFGDDGNRRIGWIVVFVVAICLAILNIALVTVSFLEASDCWKNCGYTCTLRQTASSLSIATCTSFTLLLGLTAAVLIGLVLFVERFHEKFARESIMMLDDDDFPDEGEGEAGSKQDAGTDGNNKQGNDDSNKQELINSEWDKEGVVML